MMSVILIFYYDKWKGWQLFFSGNFCFRFFSPFCAIINFSVPSELHRDHFSTVLSGFYGDVEKAPVLKRERAVWRKRKGNLSAQVAIFTSILQYFFIE